MILYLCLAYCSVFFGSRVKCHPDRIHNALSRSPFESFLSCFPDTHTKNHTAFFFSLFPLKEWRRCSRALQRRAGSSVSWVRLCCCCSSCSSSASSREARVESIQASAGQQDGCSNLGQRLRQTWSRLFGTIFFCVTQLLSHNQPELSGSHWKIWGHKFW